MKIALTASLIAALFIALNAAKADVPYNKLWPVEKYQYATCVATVLIVSNHQNYVMYIETAGAQYYGCLIEACVAEGLKGATNGSRIEIIVPLQITDEGGSRIQKRENAVDAAGNILLSNGVPYHVILGWDGKEGHILTEVVGEKEWEEYVGIHERIAQYGYDPQDPRIKAEEAVKAKEAEYRQEWIRIRTDFSEGRITEEEFKRKREEYIEKWKQDPPIRRTR